MRAENMKSRRKVRALRLLAVFICLLGLLGIRAQWLLSQAALAQAKTRAAALAANALHSTAEEVLADKAASASLIRVTCDQSGSVRLVETDTQALNQLSTRICLLAQQRLADLQAQQLSLPLSTALGLTWPSGWGPALHIGIQPSGSVSAAWSSSFTSAGVNQTRHTLSLLLTCSVTLILPAASASVSASTELVAAENIIVGEVPQTLLNSGGRLMLAP